MIMHDYLLSCISCAGLKFLIRHGISAFRHVSVRNGAEVCDTLLQALVGMTLICISLTCIPLKRCSMLIFSIFKKGTGSCRKIHIFY